MSPDKEKVLKDLIKLQQKDIDELCAELRELRAKACIDSDNIVLTTDDCPYHFATNYFYVGHGFEDTIYRCHLVSVSVSYSGNNFSPYFRITGEFYPPTGQYYRKRGHRSFKSVLTQEEALKKVERKIAKDSKQGKNVSKLIAVKKFLEDNYDFANNEAYDQAHAY